jgi:uncharacterized protein YlxW (UPF0749 family)
MNLILIYPQEDLTRTLRRTQQERESLRMTVSDIDREISQAEADEKEARAELDRSSHYYTPC